jgi:hypothetical protein
VSINDDNDLNIPYDTSVPVTMHYSEGHELGLHETIRLVERGPIDFDVLRGIALNSELSFEARGFLLYIISLPQGQSMSIYEVARLLDMLDDDIGDMVDELTNSGYIKQQAWKSAE